MSAAMATLATIGAHSFLRDDDHFGVVFAPTSIGDSTYSGWRRVSGIGSALYGARRTDRLSSRYPRHVNVVHALFMTQM
jgi:hypothetical protein